MVNVEHNYLPPKEDLPPINLSLRYTCPKCRGYKTLSISNNNNKIIYNCYRVNCTNRGILGDLSQNSSIKTIIDKLRNSIYENSVNGYKFEDSRYCINRVLPTLINLPQNAVEYLHNINPDILPQANKVGIMILYDPNNKRIVFGPQKDNLEEQNYIFIGRSIDNLHIKWWRYPRHPRTDSFKGLWYHPEKPDSSTIVIVEDAISACLLTKYNVIGLALLGTNMPEAVRFELFTYCNQFRQIKNIMIALDQDASTKGINIAHSLTGLTPTDTRVYTKLLTKDIKNCTATEIEEILKTGDKK